MAESTRDTHALAQSDMAIADAELRITRQIQTLAKLEVDGAAAFSMAATRLTLLQRHLDVLLKHRETILSRISKEADRGLDG